MEFLDVFSEKNLISHFKRKIRQKGGGGRDRMSAVTYAESNLKKEIGWIVERISKGTYRFSTYNEKLILKGAHKLPRIVSIPNIRDRWILSCLYSYISVSIGSEYKTATPNEILRKVKGYIHGHGDDEIYFAKIDFSDFYGTINQAMLARKLLSLPLDVKAVHLILTAIQTQTLPNGIKADGHPIVHGVPQGLAISNILSMVYMKEFDQSMQRIFGDGYTRYVDDILIMTNKNIDIRKKIVDEIERLGLGLILNEQKIIIGDFKKNKSMDFLGYKIEKNKIGIKHSTRQLFENRLAALCARLKRMNGDHRLLPKYIPQDKIEEYLLTTLNTTITGFVADNKLYGWLPYFREIDDISMLYAMDRLVVKFLRPNLKSLKPISFVKAYYSVNTKDKALLFNYDKLDTREKKVIFLERRGIIDSMEKYTDEEIDDLISRDKENWKKRSFEDLSHIS